MAEETKENPFTREDVLRLIEENGGKAEGLDLSGKVFEENIDLRGLDLEGIILKKARLKAAHLEKANLENANFNEAILMHAHFEAAHLIAARLEAAILDDAHLQRANLNAANLDWASLDGAHLEGACLSAATFSPNTRLDAVDWGNYVLAEEREGWFIMSDTYRRLKVWYNNAGYSDTAAKFYYREKEANRKSLKLFSKSWNHRIALQFSYWVFGHGEGWKRLLFGWVVGVIFVLAAAYYFWGSFCSSSFWDTLYYSATSFSALGYGSWAPQPTGWAKGMGAAEAIIGVFMMALLLVTFVRKWTR